MARTFPEGFLWGAATSAYQIEGAPLSDGAGPSNWHVFSHTPGRVQGDATGDIACDHYSRYVDDVGLMQELGLQAYRFSISWSRIFPDGKGPLNPAGLDFYNRLVDALVSAGITPCATLYHWDFPQALDEKGGWLNRDAAYWFADYAHTVFRALDDRVQLWATLNEPWVVMDAGYVHGVHAPGHRDVAEAPIAAHHLLLAHGAALEAYRADGRHQIGLVVNLEPKYPASDWPRDIQAVERSHAYMNRFFLDPVFLGAYPEELPELFGEAWPGFPEDDLSRIRQPIDWLGINYYKGAVMASDPNAAPARAREVRQPQRTYTQMDWPVTPEGLTDILVWVKQRYGDTPLYVTENGAAFHDPETAAGTLVEDPLRLDYYRDHLRATLAAIDAGVNLKGYFAWSLMDNFEWSYGFSKRFGIVHVDFKTLLRTPKASARFYSEIIRTNGASLEDW